MKITVKTIVKGSLEHVWECWTGLGHISNWAFASDDWGAEAIENDLRVGKTFKTRMFARDESTSFEFGGTYTYVEEYKHLTYTLDDGREVDVQFEREADGVKITQTFEAETENPAEKQREGWQAILNNFKRYTESV